MDNSDKKRLLDLIRTDLITMNGGKNNTRFLAVLLVLLFGGLGFVFSPLLGLYVPLMVSGFFVPMLFQNEIKYHSGKMFALLPIARKDMVRSRFILSVILYLAFALLFYLLMLISLKLKPYYFFLAAEVETAKEIDIIRLLAELSGMTELGLFNLLYFSAFSIGLMLVSGSLRKYFKDEKAFDATISGGLRKATKKDWAYALMFLGFLLLWILIVSDILPIAPAVSVIMQLFVQLAKAANGFLLGAVLVTMAVFSAIYKYNCTIMEYDEKEL